MPQLTTDNIYTLKNGLTVRLKAVPALMVERVQSAVPVPEPPVYYDEESNREHVNPTDPAYLTALQEFEMRKIGVSLFAAVIFGVELIDENGNKREAPSAEEDDWETKLAFLGIDWREKLREDIVLPENAKLEFARTASYLLYTQMEADDIQAVAAKVLGGGEGYGEAVNTFPGNATRNPNRTPRPKRSKQT